MEVDVDSSFDAAAAEDDLARRRDLIVEAVQDYDQDLVTAARVFAWRLDLSDRGESVAEVAADLVQATVVRALEIAGSFDPARLPRPWLMSVLAYVAKEERRRRYRHRQRTTPIRSAARSNGGDGEADGLSDDELLDRLRQRNDETDPAAGLHVDDLLELVSQKDREVLRLAVVEDLSGRDVAARLGVSEGAANVRLHRALGRLRTAYGRWYEPTNRES